MNAPRDFPLHAPTSWPASLDIQVDRSPRGSRLAHWAHTGPLYLQKAFHPEGPDCAHLYLLHPPGGLVSGDRLRVNVQLYTHAHALLTTPGAGRVYRARPDRSLQVQDNRLEVGPEATLEWLPLETIVYPDAHAGLNTSVNLQAGSRIMLWDILSLGLPANGRVFDQGEFLQTLDVHHLGELAFRERLRIDASTRHVLEKKCGFQGMPVSALMLAGPFEQGIPAEVVEHLRGLCAAAAPTERAAFTELGQFASLRVLGTCTNRARKLLTQGWKALRPVLTGKPPCEPRIWRT